MRTKVNKLTWVSSKIYYNEGIEYKITVTASLDDDCNNKICDFSITGDIYEKKRNGKWVFYSGGCIHEEIAKHFPGLIKYIPLHLCNYLGHPMYPQAKGQYFITHKSKKVAMEYLRCTSEEYEILQQYTAEEERLYFTYLLIKLGIVDRWKVEADEFIKFLEEKTGKEWVNPYDVATERPTSLLSEEELKEVEEKEKRGYYCVENVQQRAMDLVTRKNNEIRLKIIEECEQACKKAVNERDVMLYIHEYGLPLDNVIYYPHLNEVKFNWLDYENKITQEQFVDFVNNADYTKLPEGITFKI